MTASEGSFLGLAKQTAKGSINSTDAAFKYLLFRRGAFGVNNMFIPLGAEVGGGSLERSVVKVGVNTGGVLEFIPRPETLGHFFMGATGSAAISGPVDSAYTHDFTFAADEFAAPYYTVRYAPGDIWGETYQDSRFNLLSLEWRAASFVTGTLGMLGIVPVPNVSTATWGALARVDSGPQFLSPLGTIAIPIGTDALVLGGSFIAQNIMPLDQQYIVGSYYPEDLDIVSRAFILNLTVKIENATLYNKIMYDPDGGAAWAADVFKEANISLSFDSDTNIGAGTTPYSFTIKANEQTQASGDANVTWTGQALDLIAQRQIVMQLQGTFLADPLATQPVKLTVVNDKSTTY
jgi:hypothetical protein